MDVLDFVEDLEREEKGDGEAHDDPLEDREGDGEGEWDAEGEGEEEGQGDGDGETD